MATVNEKMTAIADAIRFKIDSTAPLTLDDMASSIDEVFNKGEEDGYQSGIEEGEEYGYQSGYIDGVDEGYQSGLEEGELAERNAFWEALTNNGSQCVYYYTFSESLWNKDNFKPTHNIVPTEADHMFYRHNFGGGTYDLALQLEMYGGKLDFSSCTNSGYAFDNANLTHIPEIDNSKSTFTAMFRQATGRTQLKTIDKIICSDEGDQSFTQTFNGCVKLENVAFEGVIGRNISFSTSPLTVASLKSIISCLKDYSTESPFTYTLTLKDSCKTELEVDTETVEFNGATYTYFELITAKGWNLA